METCLKFEKIKFTLFSEFKLKLRLVLIRIKLLSMYHRCKISRIIQQHASLLIFKNLLPLLALILPCLFVNFLGFAPSARLFGFSKKNMKQLHFEKTYHYMVKSTGKSLSEALIFASTNPQYDDRLFIEFHVQYMKIPSSNLGRTCCVQKLILTTFRPIHVHNMFSPSSVKIRASDKDLPVLFKFFILFD